MKRRILGIDPGTGITGFGVVDCEGDSYIMVDAGVFRTPANQPLPERLVTIYEHTKEIIATHRPSELSIERLFFARNVTTAMSVSHARGVVMLAAGQADLSVIAEYTPLQIKLAVTGYGKADKSQVQQMVKSLLKLKTIPKPDDCADALAAAVCHAMSTRDLRVSNQ